MITRPVDLPILRREAVDALRATGVDIYEKAIRSGKQGCYPIALEPREAAQVLTFAEIQRLGQAEIFYVSKEMSSLAIAAARSLPHFTLMPEDLPAKSGLIYWDEPISVVDYGPQGQAPVVAASWGPWSPGGLWSERGAIWVTWYTGRDLQVASTQALGGYPPRVLEQVRRMQPRLILDNESQIPFSPEHMPFWDGEKPVEYSQGAAENDMLLSQCVVLRTTWSLMTQTLAEVEPAAYDRAARRRIERIEKPAPAVRVITLRRPKGNAESSESDREYHHQWIVRGHWRQQWYATRGVHRPVWIAPHIKGPEGAPLLGGEKVHAWTR